MDADARKFPQDLSKVVADKWDNLVGGDWKAPGCPPETQLRQLLEVAYLASMSPEEARYPQFNIVALPVMLRSETIPFAEIWPFAERRPLTTAELRRLAPAADVRKSAVWVEWERDALYVAGLIDLGTSWNRARMGLGYQSHTAPCLLIQVDGPGKDARLPRPIPSRGTRQRPNCDIRKPRPAPFSSRRIERWFANNA